MISERIPVICADSHITEPADLWTSRMPSKFGDLIPRVEYYKDVDEDIWLIGNRPAWMAWYTSMAGFDGYFPAHPRRLDEVDPAAYDPHVRAQRMDQYGVRAQVLYPNLLGFVLHSFLAVNDAEFRIACVRAYNDFLAEFAAAEPGRFIPVMSLPFWDLEASLTELQRAAGIGHKGVLFANRPEFAGDVPKLRDPRWERLWSAAEEAGLSINFHIGFGGFDPNRQPSAPPPQSTSKADSVLQQIGFDPNTVANVDVATSSTLGFLSNGAQIAEVIMSGVADRHPHLNWVSVESGFGYVPYLLETLDWQWEQNNVFRDYPDRLLPSEYFRRQMYATFWFEKVTVERLIDLYSDNVMFETDFPHPTSLSPGPAVSVEAPNKVVEANLSGLPEEIQRKVLYENAARVYHLPALEPVGA
jgi:predicted TIM-barrel fold metal-dependent hydrolase